MDQGRVRSDKLNADESLPAHYNVQYAAVSEKTASHVYTLTRNSIIPVVRVLRLLCAVYKKKRNVRKSNRE